MSPAMLWAARAEATKTADSPVDPHLAGQSALHAMGNYEVAWVREADGHQLLPKSANPDSSDDPLRR